MGIFDELKGSLFRRGKDDPLFRKGVEKVNEILAGRQRERVSARWPLASDPDGADIFGRLRGDAAWALRFLHLDAKAFNAQRFDGPDSSGWRIGRGVHVGVLDFDPEKRAGSDGREGNDVWLEAMHEPVFGWLAYSAMPQLWLDDSEQHYRRVEVADEVPELQRVYHTGRLRGVGAWCAMAHLDPLVLRIRVDTHDASRDRVEAMAHSIFERLDVEAFVTWRERVRAMESSPHDSPTEIEPTVASAPAAVHRLPSPDDYKAHLDAPLADPAAVDLANADLEAAFGGPIEKTRSFAIPGVGEGMRYQAQGGRTLDWMRVTDAHLAAALGENRLDGATAEFHPEPFGRGRWANLDDDADGALRGAAIADDGTAYVARVRGVKREHAYRLFQVVIDKFR